MGDRKIGKAGSQGGWYPRMNTTVENPELTSNTKSYLYDKIE